jgi:membrane protein DedA with SNARE-associated domain
MPQRGRRRPWVPWQGRASGVDKALLAAILAVVAFGIVLRPLQPFLIASHPVLLGFLSGDMAAVGAAAAFARIGEVPLWLVVVAGATGMIKYDWLTWWAGRQWGQGIIRMFTTSHRALQWAQRARDADPRIVRVAVVLAMLPGVPTAVVYALAGWAGMKLTTFLLLDLVGALAMTGLVGGVGYGLGQHAVDAVLLIDRYASAVSLTLIGLTVLLPLFKRFLRRMRQARA